MNFKSGEGDEAADSTDSTARPGNAVLGLKLIHYTAAEGFPAAKMSNKGFFTCLNTM